MGKVFDISPKYLFYSSISALKTNRNSGVKDEYIKPLIKVKKEKEEVKFHLSCLFPPPSHGLSSLSQCAS